MVAHNHETSKSSCGDVDRMGQLMPDEDSEKSKKVAQAMSKRVNMDIEGLKKAYQG